MPSALDPAIFVAADIASRRVTSRCMQALGIGRACAVGHLVMFWCEAAQRTSDGVVTDFADDILEDWAGWRGKRGAFATFLRSSHLDQAGRPKDWDEYAGRLTATREENRRRQQRHRVTSRERNATSHADVTVTATLDAPVLTSNVTSSHTAPSQERVKNGEKEIEQEQESRSTALSSLPTAQTQRGLTVALTGPVHDVQPSLLGGLTPAVMLERANGIRATAKRQDAALAQMRGAARLVFAYWALKFGHNKVVLDEKRLTRIVSRLRENGSDVSELLYALDGARKDDHIMGRNGGPKYDGIETVLRDRGQVEKFSSRVGYAPDKTHPFIAEYREGES